MLVAEVMKQIACVASCGYNFSPQKHLQNIVVCLTSDFLKPKNFQTTDTAPVFGTSSSVSLLAHSETSVSELSLCLSIFSPLNDIRTLNTGCALTCCLFGAAAKQSPLKQCPAARRSAAMRSQHSYATHSPVLGYMKNSYHKKKKQH